MLENVIEWVLSFLIPLCEMMGIFVVGVSSAAGI